jgi:hypothetical protein
MNTSTPTTAPHLAVQGLMQAQALPPSSLRPDGRLTLVVDQRYRVHVSPGADGRVVLNATVAMFDPTEPPAHADRLIERLLQLAQGLLKGHASGLHLSQHGDTLGLQQWLPAQVSVQQLQEALAHFVNDLSFWVRAAKSP